MCLAVGPVLRLGRVERENYPVNNETLALAVRLTTDNFSRVIAHRNVPPADHSPAFRTAERCDFQHDRGEGHWREVRGSFTAPHY